MDGAEVYGVYDVGSGRSKNEVIVAVMGIEAKN